MLQLEQDEQAVTSDVLLPSHCVEMYWPVLQVGDALSIQAAKVITMPMPLVVSPVRAACVISTL